MIYNDLKRPRQQQNAQHMLEGHKTEFREYARFEVTKVGDQPRKDLHGLAKGNFLLVLLVVRCAVAHAFCSLAER